MEIASLQPLRWTSWPARERPLAAAIGGAAIACFGAAGAMAGGHWSVGAACSAALLIALHRFYVPVRCEVAGDAATVRSLLGSRSISLSGVRRIAHDTRLVVLSPRAVAGAIGAGDLLLPLPAESHGAVVEAIRDRVGRARGRLVDA